MALTLSQTQYDNILAAATNDPAALMGLREMIESGDLVIGTPPAPRPFPDFRLTEAQRALIRKIEAAPEGKLLVEEYCQDWYVHKSMPQIDKNVIGRGKPLTIITRCWVSVVQIEINPPCVTAIVEALGAATA